MLGDPRRICDQATTRVQRTEALRNRVRSRIAGYKVPKTIVFLPDLPQTGTGKVDKRALITRLTIQSAGTGD